MPRYSRRSKEKLDSCHADLQQLFNEVIKFFDCTIICGQRDEEYQNKYYNEGKTKLKYPQSKHNSCPSLAVDVAPYPVDWDDLDRFYYFSGYVLGIARQLNIHIRWGGDWAGSTLVKENSFKDLVHFELI